MYYFQFALSKPLVEEHFAGGLVGKVWIAVDWFGSDTRLNPPSWSN